MTAILTLKTPITFRLNIGPLPREVAWSTKALRVAKAPDTNPEAKDHVAFDVTAIGLDSDSVPWFHLDKPTRATILWSNVLSVQYDDPQ